MPRMNLSDDEAKIIEDYRKERAAYNMALNRLLDRLLLHKASGITEIGIGELENIIMDLRNNH